MSKHRRRRRTRRVEHARATASKRTVLAGTGLSLGAAIGMTGTAEAADFPVSNLSDSGAGSLRQAILDANATPGADRVLFQSALSGQITLGSQLPIVTEATEILGPGPNKVTVSGNNAVRIFEIEPTVANDPVTISGLRLTGGSTDASGGAIRSKYATLTVENAVITGNRSLEDSSGGAIANGGGGLTVRSSTISGNSSSESGGGISSDHREPSPGLTIESSTITGNGAGEFGGGVFFGIFKYESPINIRNSTISGNSAANAEFGGGGLFVDLGGNPRTMTNTIVADNAAPVAPDINTYAGTTLDTSFSLVENPSGANLTGSPNITGVDPKLGSLADNGGPTPTVSLLTGSPALDKGSASGVDQRGALRPFDLNGVSPPPGGNSADIGAYERVLCGKIAVNRIGTPGNEKISGTKGADGILGLGGKDRLKGLAGRDALCGGPGRDILRGGGGKDKLLGQAGPDRLFGGKGKDILKGGKGKDKQTQ